MNSRKQSCTALQMHRLITVLLSVDTLSRCLAPKVCFALKYLYISKNNDCFHQKWSKLFQQNIFPTEKLQAWSKLGCTEAAPVPPQVFSGREFGFGVVWKNHSWAAPWPPPSLRPVLHSAECFAHDSACCSGTSLLHSFSINEEKKVISFCSKSK